MNITLTWTVPTKGHWIKVDIKLKRVEIKSIDRCSFFLVLFLRVYRSNWYITHTNSTTFYYDKPKAIENNNIDNLRERLKRGVVNRLFRDYLNTSDWRSDEQKQLHGRMEEIAAATTAATAAGRCVQSGTNWSRWTVIGTASATTAASAATTRRPTKIGRAGHWTRPPGQRWWRQWWRYRRCRRWHRAIPAPTSTPTTTAARRFASSWAVVRKQQFRSRSFTARAKPSDGSHCRLIHCSSNHTMFNIDRSMVDFLWLVAVAAVVVWGEMHQFIKQRSTTERQT